MAVHWRWNRDGQCNIGSWEMWAVAMQSHRFHPVWRSSGVASWSQHSATYLEIFNSVHSEENFIKEDLYWFHWFTLLYITHVVSMEQVFNFTLGIHLMVERLCNKTSSNFFAGTCLAVRFERFSGFRLNCGLKLILTSFVVFVVVAGDLHGNAAACPSPASVAFTAPAVLTHDALTVTVAQAWTSICRRQWKRQDWSMLWIWFESSQITSVKEIMRQKHELQRTGTLAGSWNLLEHY